MPTGKNPQNRQQLSLLLPPSQFHLTPFPTLPLLLSILVHFDWKFRAKLKKEMLSYHNNPKGQRRQRRKKEIRKKSEGGKEHEEEEITHDKQDEAREEGQIYEVCPVLR